MTELIFEASPWFILLCLLAGLAYAWLLYPASVSWPPKLRWLLFTFRALCVSLLAILLLGPLLRRVLQQTEPARIVFAIDNSASIPAATDSVRYPEEIRQTLQAVSRQLQDNERQLEWVSLNHLSEETSIPGREEEVDFEDLRFDAQSTNLAELLKDIRDRYENRNLSAVVLVSDGRFNQGYSPDYLPLPFPVYTLGVGDTLPKTDLILSQLLYNKLVYQGNQFVLRAEIQQQGLGGQPVRLLVEKDGKVLASQSLNLPEDNGQPLAHEFILDAEEAGMQRYTVRVQALEGEFSQDNNAQQAYLEVLEGKEKILLAAYAPHPDLKAITAALEQNANYEIVQYIPGLNTLDPGPYDLVILHQLPTAQPVPELQPILQATRSKLYILGRQTSLSAFNQENGLLIIRPSGQEMDEVFPAWNNSQSAFELPENLHEHFRRYPPVRVPFGEYQLQQPAEMVLQQRIGNISTEKPLLLLQTSSEQKTGILLGEGSWKWRLREYTLSENFRAYDELIQRSVQVLTSREDRRLFRVYPLQREIAETEPVIFETEVYNTAMQPVYDLPIRLQLRNEEGETREFNYTTAQNNTRYTLGPLPAGIYRYTATTERAGERLQSSGEFSVQKLQLETQNLQADFALLRNLADNTGGRFFTLEQADSLPPELSQKTARSILFSEEQLQAAINLPWLFFLLLLLLSTEWFLRKYNGGY